MCGILGWIGVEDATLNKERFGKALDLLAHRGPDDRGIVNFPGVLLGHRRLSITDLSTSGHQPMIDPVSGATIIFNGEIYNHIELRSELLNFGYQFRSTSDTEVLLYALLQWGEHALVRLNGMFAFAEPSIETVPLASPETPIVLEVCHAAAVFALPNRDALTAVAENIPDASLLTIVEFVFASVAASTRSV